MLEMGAMTNLQWLDYSWVPMPFFVYVDSDSETWIVVEYGNAFVSLAALLTQKPVEAILPMIAANVMEYNGETRQSLFYLLVLPPMVCSVLQMIAWTSFDLTPRRVAVMRRELQVHQSNSSSFIDILDP